MVNDEFVCGQLDCIDAENVFTVESIDAGGVSAADPLIYCDGKVLAKLLMVELKSRICVDWCEFNCLRSRARRLENHTWTRASVNFVF